MTELTKWLNTWYKCSEYSHGDMAHSGLNQDLQRLVYEFLSADALFLGNIFFAYFLHLHTGLQHTGLQVQWWLMLSTVVLTSLNKPIVKLSRLQMLLYSDLPGPGRWSTSSAPSSGFSGSFFLAWPLKGSFLPSYDPSHCPLTSIFSLSTFPRTSLTLYYEDLVAIIKWSLFFRRFWSNCNLQAKY